MDTTSIDPYLLETCKKILRHFCNTNKEISLIEIDSGIEVPTQSDIDNHFDKCLDYLVVQKMIHKVSERGYEITKEGKRFCKNTGLA